MMQFVRGCLGKLGAVVVAAVALAACTGGDPQPLPTYSIGGSVGGLVGTVELQNTQATGVEALTIGSSGAFAFSTPVKRGQTFSVEVRTQPAGQTCNVTNGTGIASADVTDILVICTGGGATFTIGGNVSGLDGRVLLRNGDDTVAVSRSGSFTFPTAVPDGTPYAVTVDSQPAGQTCLVENGTGTINNANVRNVLVTCNYDTPPPTDTTYTIGGSVSGLTGGDLLRLELEHAGDRSTIEVGSNGPFDFGAEEVTAGDPYTVRVASTPAGKTCTIANGSGVATANVTNVIVSCTTNTPPPPASYSIGGSVSGLQGNDRLRLELEHAGDRSTIELRSDGPFDFGSEEVTAGDAYTVRVESAPDDKTCTIVNGSGIANADVTNVTVTCTEDAPPPPPATYSVGGSVAGLLGGTLTLGLTHSGGTGTTIDVASNGAFNFDPQRVTEGASYTVAIVTQPEGHTCTVANGSGTASADVTTVLVACVPVATTSTYSVGGTIQGLTGAGLAIEHDAANRVTPDSTATAFTLPVEFDDGAVYDVGIAVQPAGQTCVITQSQGAIAGADVTDLAVTCIDNVTDPIVGTFALAELDPDSVAYLTLFADGVYVYGSVENDPACGASLGNGAEHGVYSYDAGSGAFSIKAAVVDTNGACGVWDGASRFSGTLVPSGGGPDDDFLLMVPSRGLFELEAVESRNNQLYGSFADAYHRNVWVFVGAGDDDDDEDELYVFNTQTQAGAGSTAQGRQSGVEYVCAELTGSSDNGALTPDFSDDCDAPAPGEDGPVDTSGAAGLSHLSGAWPFAIGGDVITSPTFRGIRVD
jgi:hypothetical protein